MGEAVGALATAVSGRDHPEDTLLPAPVDSGADGAHVTGAAGAGAGGVGCWITTTADGH